MTVTNTTSNGMALSRSIARLIAIPAIGLLMILAMAGTARASLAFDSVSVSLDQPPRINLGNDVNNPSDDSPVVNPDGTFADPLFERQAGSHPDLTLGFKVKTGVDGLPLEAPRDVELDLPKGMVGNPTGVETCSPQALSNPSQGGADCPVAAQVGTADITAWASSGTQQQITVGLFNIAHGPDVPAKFGFKYSAVVGLITARVRPGDYGISSGSFSISQGESVESVRLRLWGVPADHSHDWTRQDRAAAISAPFNTPQAQGFVRQIQTPARPFLTLPTSCSDEPLSFTLRGASWENPGKFDTKTVTADEDGVPFAIEGCERLGFNPSAQANSLAHSADGPSGLDVDVTVPQPQDPDGLSPAHVRQVKMTFPQGVSVSPSSAAGLAACSPAQIGLGTNDAPTCPQQSKLGTIEIDTPLLDYPLVGDMILATQNDNPYNTLVALYIAAKGPGFYLKLPGRVDLDAATGQMTVLFDNTPQLPFSNMKVHFNGGSQAALAMPLACGAYSTRIELMSWASNTPVVLNSPMNVDQNCGPKPFAPSFSSGTTNPLAGQHSAFTMTLTRTDGMPYLSQIETALPPGLLADVASVPRCDAAAANGGWCPAVSKIGTTSVLSGPGAQPLGLTGNVYLTGPYKDAPFGLSIAVPTAGQAGPFDLGMVVVRAGIYVDRKDAHVTVKSDPLPTIIQGVPLRMRQVVVSIDRPNFIINPTSCAKQSIFGSFGALGGGTSNQLVSFQVGGCGDLDLKPKMSMKVTGKSATKDGTYPGVDATLTDIGGGSNYDKVEAKLPLALVLEPEHAQALCKPEQAAAFNCPKSSIVGTARAKSVLPSTLSGPVYFVEGLRKTATGRVVKTLPDLWIPLSGDGVTIDVRAKSQVDKTTNRLITTFHDLPDAPIKTFNLKINGGKTGILVVSGKSTCSRDMAFDLRYTGQNKETKVATSKPKVEGCKPTVKSTKTSKRSVSVKVGNIAAGSVTVTGGGLLSRASRTLKAGPEATVTAKLTSKARAALRRHGKVSVMVSVTYKPKSGKTVKLSKTVIVKA
jgi:hypothetical protein